MNEDEDTFVQASDNTFSNVIATQTYAKGNIFNAKMMNGQVEISQTSMTGGIEILYAHLNPIGGSIIIDDLSIENATITAPSSMPCYDSMIVLSSSSINITNINISNTTLTLPNIIKILTTNDLYVYNIVISTSSSSSSVSYLLFIHEIQSHDDYKNTLIVQSISISDCTDISIINVYNFYTDYDELSVLSISRIESTDNIYTAPVVHIHPVVNEWFKVYFNTSSFENDVTLGD